MTRLLVLNNYPLDQVWDEVRRGEKPDHHLYGLNHFASQGFEVEIIPYRSSAFLQRLSLLLSRSRLPIPLGDLDQQISVLRLLQKGARQSDIIYAPCQTQTHLLAYLHTLGLLRTPIVCLGHHPLESGRLQWLRRPFQKLFVHGTDVFPSLSQGVANSINRLATKGFKAAPDPKSQPLWWGPDVHFYPAQPSPGRGVIAAGRTGRDFETFGTAASLASSPAHIICSQSDAKPDFSHFTDNVQVSVVPDTDYMKYPQLLSLYAQSRVLAIPLLSSFNLAGLTSLLDALGMGKPVIMTRHPLIDLDIEELGIGKWVEIGDVEGWRAAIQFFEDNEDEAFAMGMRARKLVEEGYNSTTFATQMVNIFHQATAAS